MRINKYVWFSKERVRTGQVEEKLLMLHRFSSELCLILRWHFCSALCCLFFTNVCVYIYACICVWGRDRESVGFWLFNVFYRIYSRVCFPLIWRGEGKAGLRAITVWKGGPHLQPGKMNLHEKKKNEKKNKPRSLCNVKQRSAVSHNWWMQKPI